MTFHKINDILNYVLCLIQQMELIFSLCKFSSAVIAVMLREENMLIEDVYRVQNCEN